MTKSISTDRDVHTEMYMSSLRVESQLDMLTFEVWLANETTQQYCNEADLSARTLCKRAA